MRRNDIDDILARIAEGKATPEELEAAERHLQGVEERLATQIDHWAGDAARPKRPSATVWLRRVAAVAACLALTFSIVHFTQREHPEPVVGEMQQDTYDNPEEAAAAAERALLKFSTTINKAVCYRQ